MFDRFSAFNVFSVINLFGIFHLCTAVAVSESRLASHAMRPLGTISSTHGGEISVHKSDLRAAKITLRMLHSEFS
jgi:hypothetical protein